MMITIHASMSAKPGKRDHAVAAFKTAMEGSQSEAGCIVYQFAADIADSNLFHIIEVWDGEDSLFAHLGGEAFKGFMAVAGEIVDPVGMSAWSGPMKPYRFPG